MSQTQSVVEKTLQLPLDKNLKTNISYIKDVLEDSVDLVKRDFIFHDYQSLKAACFYTDGLTNTSAIEKLLEALQYEATKILDKITVLEREQFIKQLKENLIMNASLKEIKKVSEAIDAILVGDTVLLVDGSSEGLIISSKGFDARSVEEPMTEQVVRGPRDGFTENIRTNTALVRRRIRDPLFRIDAMQIGKKTKTDINIAYLKETVKPGLVDEVKKRLKKIEIDSVLESGYIEEFIEDAPLSPFPTVQSTERPDKVAGAILEGRVAIFIDNTPFVLVVPSYFWQYLQASDDYYSRYYTGSFFRLIRYIAFVISLTLPSLYVLLASFHQEMIPTPLALTIASGREVVPYPVLLEALIMETAFELMREAGLRMPKPVGQAVSIVGSLIIGQAAVQAGLVSPFMVIIVALTGIASFAIPNYAAAFSIRLIRFPLLLASGTLGLLGFAAAFSIIAIHAISLRSFGEPYLAPATPFQPSDQKDAVIRLPWWKMNKQPQLAEGEENREGDNQKPSPPKSAVNESVTTKATKQAEASKKEQQDNDEQSNYTDGSSSYIKKTENLAKQKNKHQNDEDSRTDNETPKSIKKEDNPEMNSAASKQNNDLVDVIKQTKDNKNTESADNATQKDSQKANENTLKKKQKHTITSNSPNNDADLVNAIKQGQHDNANSSSQKKETQTQDTKRKSTSFHSDDELLNNMKQPQRQDNNSATSHSNAVGQRQTNTNTSFNNDADLANNIKHDHTQGKKLTSSNDDVELANDLKKKQDNNLTEKEEASASSKRSQKGRPFKKPIKLGRKDKR
ncbi:hypothetical protein EJF36_01200 [Bacillus sp. HMF5848]|uniref:spore germination protein n=1 Tax=Bacillus sp. HMF5848 TaxID=2495421 RepID=UPI000F77BE4A|nr:spore germination protein [Bacillus sp. HMF5848]RSK25637.1 hypothetical protein EJF36_01200 [Bacillus sp. HMF5848]